MGYQYLDHQLYSPDLTPSYYHLFPGLKTQLKSSYFSSNTEVISAVETWLEGQNSDFFEWFAKRTATG
jgi:histone-lysine N-methyltransferase SETMAR